MAVAIVDTFSEVIMYLTLADAYSRTNPIVILDVSDLNMGDLSERYSGLLHFRTDTYSSLERGSGMGGANTYGPVNNFFGILSKEDQVVLAEMYLTMHLYIQENLSDLSKMDETLDAIGEVLDVVDQNIRLCEKLESFTRRFIPIADLADAGTRDQDTPEMTFDRNEVIVVTALAMLSKLMSPVMGAFISRCKKREDNELKEIHCLTLFTRLFNRRYSALYNRLEYYVNTLVKDRIKDDQISRYRGISDTTMTLRILATLFIKGFVNSNLYENDSNIMRYITACARSSTKSHHDTAAKNTIVQYRTDPADMDGKEDGNTSRMENESRPSSTTADVPVLVEFAANYLWKKILKTENINEDDFNAALAFYAFHPVHITPVNIYVLSSYYGLALGGAHSVRMLTAEVYSRLVAAHQFSLLKLGREEDIVMLHAMSLLPSMEVKAELSEHDDRLLTHWRNTQAYARCRQTFPKGFGEKSWDGELEKIVKYLTNQTMWHQTPPVFWDKLGLKSRNDESFLQNAELLAALCNTIYYIYTREQEG